MAAKAHREKTKRWARNLAWGGFLPLTAATFGRVAGLLPSEATALGALGIVLLAGLGVRPLLDFVAPSPEAPEGVDKQFWGRLVDRTDGGPWIGTGERLLFVTAVLMREPTLIAGWLAFKLASKWESWKNVIQVPKELKSVPDEQEWFVARSDLGSWLLNRFWLGTLSNVLAAFAAAKLGSALAELAARWK